MRIDAPVTAASGKQSPPLYRGALCFRAGGTGDSRKEDNHWQDDASTTASGFGMSFVSRTLLSSEYFGLEKKKNMYPSNLIEASFPFGKAQKWVL